MSSSYRFRSVSKPNVFFASIPFGNCPNSFQLFRLDRPGASREAIPCRYLYNSQYFHSIAENSEIYLTVKYLVEQRENICMAQTRQSSSNKPKKIMVFGSKIVRTARFRLDRPAGHEYFLRTAARPYALLSHHLLGNFSEIIHADVIINNVFLARPSTIHPNPRYKSSNAIIRQCCENSQSILHTPRGLVTAFPVRTAKYPFFSLVNLL